MRLKNKIIAVLGAKRSGLACARLILRLGGYVRISDAGEKFLTPEEKNWCQKNKIPCEWGQHSETFLAPADMFILSPGVSIYSPIVQWARREGKGIMGEIEFASQFTTKPIIAVTGSNGKTTVCTLIHQMLALAQKKSCLCGNVGFPFSDFCTENQYDYFVLEVSSFQMESLLSNKKDDVKGFAPKIAILLNFNQNHLDRHKNLDEYFSAKSRIFQNQSFQDHAVINGDNERCLSIAATLKSQVHIFHKKEMNPNLAAVKKVGEILDIPEHLIQETFSEFKGVEHRLEWVRHLAGIDFFNDSKATTAEAGYWALEQFDQPVLMICGGRDKNMDFSVLQNIVADKVKQVFVFGEAKDKIQKTFEGYVPVHSCERLEDAVSQARHQAVEGDCVVLSPMCASFDMFSNFEERGKKFKDLVMELN